MKDLTTQLELQPFRAKQLMTWLYKFRHCDFSQMTDIAKPVRLELEKRYRIYRPEIETVATSKDHTKKFLFRLEDGERIEAVLIHQERRNTLCLSSQVGCSLGCRFCRTARMGLKRHLETFEIVGQLLAIQDSLVEESFSNIVFMGMGEPFDNIDNVARAIRIINDNLGLDFSQRKITVSTAGVVPGIEAFAKSGAQANLAVSLNATTDEVRSRIMPINRKYPLAQLIEALRNYPLLKRQRITIEYVLLAGINDSDADLSRLSKLLRGIPVKINLIPFNEHSGLDFSAPKRSVIEKWQKELDSKRLLATIRWSRGEDINAACGQLAASRSVLQKESSLRS